jgi:hypothetical protein
MTWLTCVISCLSDEQAIKTWQERALTGTRTTNNLLFWFYLSDAARNQMY